MKNYKLIVLGVLLIIIAVGLIIVQLTKAPALPIAQNNMPTLQPAPKTMTIPLLSLNNSQEYGSAVLTEMADGVKVVLTIANEAPGSTQPAHIHSGACPNPGAVVYPLSSVVDGKSETVIKASLDQLSSKLPLAINVHQSAKEIKSYLACGDFTSSKTSSAQSY